jgi:predicted GH43/DUF377 family glycosyl hydrolase
MTTDEMKAHGVFTRSKANPVLSLDHLQIEASAVLNPGVAELEGEVILLLRIEDRTGISHIRVARSSNGVDGWSFDEEALLEADQPDHPLEEWGCEDARVTKIGPKEWVIAYTAYSRYGPAVALALTEDFRSARRLGVVLSPENKDATVFPRRFDNSWVMLHRPVTGTYEHIWYVVSESDLNHWSSPGVLLPERGGPWWDANRVGVGAPPIETAEGWLLIYHGVKQMSLGLIYRLGLALLDIEDPRRMIARASPWVFSPEEPYEMIGLNPNVVYTCGTIQRGDETWMYYGAADSAIGLATARTSDLVRFVKDNDFLCVTGRQKGMMDGQ